jgi:flavin reductase (DIM6/NTAB) family NADH-FMN oxidoreductase RutF
VSLDSTEYRRIIGNFATGVTVVTTDVEGMLHGMTANAVTSVSLEPLLILVCVDKGAVSHAQMQAASHFGVNILSEAQQDLSNTFAASKPPEEGSLRGAPFRRAASGVPLLEGTLAWLDCEVDQAVDAGDHTIFIGRVLDGSVDCEDNPLLYFRGGYRAIG